jgi:Rrf2 family protein
MGRLLNISDAANLAVHALIVIAREPDRRWSVTEVATVLDVSEAHLGKVLQRLVHQDFLRSRRGPGGGFEPGQPPDRGSLMEVITAIDGPFDGGGWLLGRAPCQHRKCLMGGPLGKIQTILWTYLSTTKLSDLVKAELHGPPPCETGDLAKL